MYHTTSNTQFFHKGKRIFNIVSGMIIGIGPFIIAAFISVLIYNELHNFIGIGISALLIGASVWLGVAMFKKVQLSGLVDFLTVVNASPDLDNLTYTSDELTKTRTPEELVQLTATNQNLCKGGTLRIFGDWFGEPYNNVLPINSIQYKSTTNKLIVNFRDHQKLTIIKPMGIVESENFFKIVDAEEIKLEFEHQNEPYFINYIREKRRIKTASNINWYKPTFDVSAGQPALVIYS